MQFQRNTSASKSNALLKIIIKVALVFLLFFIVVVLFDKIDFPSPNKKIEKIISNENLKIIK
jgi:phosphotransferase system  glucose/maltose/N-acetylglucosamine-specific IIC component